MNTPCLPRRFSRLALLGTLPLLTLAVQPALLAEPPTVVESTTAATAGKDTLAVNDNNHTKTIDADGKDVAINGNDNKITVTGKCHALTVSGNNNVVNADAVASITTPGNGNQVVWSQPVGGEKPQITNLGSKNEINKRAE